MAFAKANKRLGQRPLYYRAFCWAAFQWCIYAPMGRFWWALLPYAGEHANFGGNNDDE